MENLFLKQLNHTKVNGNSYEGFYPKYEAEGYRKAKMGSGNNIVLPDNLNAIYREQTESVDKDNQHIKSIELSYKNTNEKLGRENEILSDINHKVKTERIPCLEQQRNQVRETIADMKSNPQAYLGEKIDRTSYYIGTTILVLLTFYLIVFYSSASYSAFFRIYVPGVNLREAMLDPKTFIKALNDGFGELLFILLMPFIFLALGYLIHKFFENKSIINYLKVMLLFMVAFVFDGFIAYKITEGIESVNQTLLSEDYTLETAIKDINFWVVIFAGFVTYIVFGVVFDFVMRARQNSDRIGLLIKLKYEKIAEIENAIDEEYKNIESNEKQIDKNKIEITKNDEDMLSPVISLEDIKRTHYQFMSGWKNYMLEISMPMDSIAESDKIANHCLENYIYNITKTY